LSLLGASQDAARLFGICVFGLVAVAVFFARLRGLPLSRSAGIVMGALIVCSPVVHFWYLTWLLPFAVLRPSFALGAASISMAGYFLAWQTQDLHGWWGYGHTTAAAIWFLPMLAFLAQHRSLRRRSVPVSASAKLSIVVPTLNVGGNLSSFISSLRSSVPKDTEIILADGGSTDASLDGIQEKIISSEPGRGQQIAAGIAASSGDWILIAHADTLPADGWHQRLCDAIHRHPQAAMLILGQRFSPQSFRTLLIEILNELRVIFGGVAFGDQTMVIRRQSLEACGGFPAQPLMEDVEVSLRLQTAGDIIYLGQEWQVSARKWGKGFLRRFVMIVRLMIVYQIARARSPDHARRLSLRLYAEYYGNFPVKISSPQNDSSV
jgi:GT2 family glycosyltransferase